MVEPPIRKVVEVYRGTDVHHVVFNEAGELLSTEAAVTPAVELVSPAENVAATARQPNVASAELEKVPHLRREEEGPISAPCSRASATSPVGQPTLARQWPTGTEPSARNTRRGPSADPRRNTDVPGHGVATLDQRRQGERTLGRRRFEAAIAAAW